MYVLADDLLVTGALRSSGRAFLRRRHIATFPTVADAVTWATRSNLSPGRYWIERYRHPATVQK